MDVVDHDAVVVADDVGAVALAKGVGRGHRRRRAEVARQRLAAPGRLHDEQLLAGEGVAQAEAEATRLVSDAIAAGNVQAINYFVAQRYVDALKDIASAPNQKTLILPLEATSILGSLQGVAEIARDAFGRKG